MAKRNARLRAFVRIKENGEVVPGSLILRKIQPKSGRWYEIPSDICCLTTSTTTTTAGA